MSRAQPSWQQYPRLIFCIAWFSQGCFLKRLPCQAVESLTPTITLKEVNTQKADCRISVAQQIWKMIVRPYHRSSAIYLLSLLNGLTWGSSSTFSNTYLLNLPLRGNLYIFHPSFNALISSEDPKQSFFPAKWSSLPPHTLLPSPWTNRVCCEVCQTYTCNPSWHQKLEFLWWFKLCLADKIFNRRLLKENIWHISWKHYGSILKACKLLMIFYKALISEPFIPLLIHSQEVSFSNSNQD